jgi:hypothetical protein
MTAVFVRMSAVDAMTRDQRTKDNSKAQELKLSYRWFEPRVRS